MSNDVVITVENLSKRYRLGQIGVTSLRESAEHWWHKVRGRDPRDHMGVVAPEGRGQKAEDGLVESGYMWALKDVSFEVKKGEVLGIIGKNGAGKSTLLKILSRITEPTSGRAILRGRVGSLLEVGTGFHPELSGRENIFLNGAILGMKKREVVAKFDEIVAFAEVEKFVDTPVKRYSSGMYVRLAFAVAAHLDPEILVVDEVLAVGDIGFQKKCLGKMNDVAHEGRTVLFVSHNMGTIGRLCPSSMLLGDGLVLKQGGSSDVVDLYLAGKDSRSSMMTWDSISAPGDNHVRLLAVRVTQEGQKAVSNVDITKPFEIEVDMCILRPMREFTISILIFSSAGEVVLHTGDIASSLIGAECSNVTSVCHLPAYCFNVGNYTLSVCGDIPNKSIAFYEHNIVAWTVDALCPDMGRYGTRIWQGVIGPGLGRWQFSVGR